MPRRLRTCTSQLRAPVLQPVPHRPSLIKRMGLTCARHGAASPPTCRAPRMVSDHQGPPHHPPLHRTKRTEAASSPSPLPHSAPVIAAAAGSLTGKLRAGSADAHMEGSRVDLRP